MGEVKEEFMKDWDKAMLDQSYGTGGPLIKNTKLIIDKFGCD